MSVSKLVFVLWLSFMIFISALLIVEYNFFKQKSVQLEELKDDYANYILAMKKLISDYGLLKDVKDQNPETDSKKKTNNLDSQSEESSFLVVNRDFSYLKKSALKYARGHNIEVALQSMYEADSFSIYVDGPRRAGKSRNRRLKSSTRFISASSFEKSGLDDSKKIQREPIFIWPINKSQFWGISSPFGPRRRRNGVWEFHSGIDMPAARGTIVKAAGSGVVVQASYLKGYGNCVVIGHNRRFKTRYAHLDKILVTVGQMVNQGDHIGKVGATGSVRSSKRGGDPSHLHFEVLTYGKRVNPLYFLHN